MIKAPKHAPTRALGGDAMSAHRLLPRNQGVARFAGAKVDPDRVIGLREDHPAIVEGRTLFPSTVVKPMDSPRMLVSGHNNPKLGKVFAKGPWEGMPLYQLSLEERATCPRSCLQFRDCYGNAMHLARRHDHTDVDFLPLLAAELVTTARAHPKGFVVRLHTLGDFYSTEYVRFWADQLDRLPNLRVFGYTARRLDADDAQSRQIALAIQWLTEQAWDVFAIRFSGRDGPQGTIVTCEPDAREHVIMCPAQSYETAACVTCGLCSAEGAREKTIGFLRHGIKKKDGKQRARIDQHRRRGAADDGRVQRAAMRAYARNIAAGELPAPEAQEPAEPTKRNVAGFHWRPRAKLGISPQEQDALAAEAVAAGRVQLVAPGRAWGAEPTRCNAGARVAWVAL